MAKGLTKAEKDRWVKALVSGRYKQGGGQLYNDSTKKYCCLGVECVVNKRVKKNKLAGVALPSDLGLETLSMFEKQLADLNDGTYIAGMIEEDRVIPFELIAGLLIEPWNGVD